MEGEQRRKYGVEFQAEAVRLVESGRSQAEVARQFGEMGSAKMALRRSVLERPCCPLCGKRRSAHVLDLTDTWIAEARGSRVFAVLRCVACGALYTSPRFRRESRDRAFGRHYPFYLRARQVLSGAAICDHVEARRPYLGRARRLAGWAGRSGALLDVGCGDGFFCDAMRRRGWQVTGIDVEPLVVHHARRELGLDCRVLDAERQALPTGRFEAIALWGVLQLAYRPRRLLEKLRRSLARGGVLAIGVSNAAGAGAEIFGANWYGYGVPRHLVHFTPTTLTKLVEASGYRVLETRFESPNWILERSLQLAAPGQSLRAQLARKQLRRLCAGYCRRERSETMELYARPI
jgi:SAM-dependent methyltransferase